MLRKALVERRGRVSRGVHDIVYHTTRSRCTDRVRDFERLRSILYQFGMASDLIAPCYDVNEHAMASSVQQTGECLQIKGYQVYEVCAGTGVTSMDNYLNARLRAFDGINLNKTQILDIGGNAGFYSAWALQHGAASSTIIEQDQNAIQAGQIVRDFLSCDMRYAPFSSMREADIVVAFAVVHWLMSCTDSFGSLTEIVYYLRTLTRSTLLVEWIDPLDGAIRDFGHVDPSFAYTRIQFEMLLRDYFSAFEFVAKSREHRYIYRAHV